MVNSHIDSDHWFDRLSRTIAHKRTHMRGIRSYPPIAGGAVSCSNSDQCAYLTDTIGDRNSSWFNISDELHAVYDELANGGGELPFWRAFVTFVESALNHITVEVNRTGETIGTPATGETVFHDLGTILTDLNNLDAANTFFQDTYYIPTTAALPYPNSQANDVHADINRAIADILLGTALGQAIAEVTGAAVGTIGTINKVIGIFLPNSTGGTTTINYNDSLIASGSVPPYESLTLGSSHSLGGGANIDIPVGTYGYEFSFTVPSYWARRGAITDDLSPAVAVLEFLRGAFSFENPTYVRRENWLAYPLHPAAKKFTVDLAPGVTGTYAPLVL